MEELANHSQSIGSLATILVIFAIAGVFVPIFQKLHFSPILGYLTCGVIVGPFGLAQFSHELPFIRHITISNTMSVSILGEIGIIFLMFMIGLELSLHRLLEMKRLVLGLGSAQILITASLIAIVASFFDNSVPAAILIGCSFALSSTGIVMQLLFEHHKTNRPVGMVAFAILLMQDLAVVPLLVILGSLTKAGVEGNIPLVLAKSMLIASFVIITIYTIGTKFLKPMLEYLSLSKNPEWLISLVFLLVLGSAAITQSAGLSAALGAFLAGLMIAETDFKHEVEVIIEPVKSLLLGIFFLYVGMQINVQEVLRHPIWIPFSVIGLFATKSICLYPVARSFKLSQAISFEVATRLAQAGEFAFLILGLAINGNLMPKENGQFFLLVASLSMFATPLLTKLSPFIMRRLGHFFAIKDEADLDHDPKLTDRPEVLIAGYGRVGRMLGSILEDSFISYIAIDHNFERVKTLKQQNHRVVYADARRSDIWRKLYIDTAKAVVIATEDPGEAEVILRAVRNAAPLIPAIVRTHDTAQMDKLYGLGATYAIPEILESSIMVAEKTLATLGMEQDAIDREIEQSRQSAVLKHVDVDYPL